MKRGRKLCLKQGLFLRSRRGSDFISADGTGEICCRLADLGDRDALMNHAVRNRWEAFRTKLRGRPQALWML